MKWTILITVLLINTHAWCQAYLPTEHLTTRDGLSFRIVNSITKDQEGYMWISTQEGLNRHDGVNWTIYKHRSGDSTSINYNHVRQVIEDKDGNLLIYLQDENLDGKLDYFDKKTETFKRARFQNLEQGQFFRVRYFSSSPSGSVVALVTLEKRRYPDDLPTLMVYEHLDNGRFEFRKELSKPSTALPSERVQASLEREP